VDRLTISQVHRGSSFGFQKYDTAAPGDPMHLVAVEAKGFSSMRAADRLGLRERSGTLRGVRCAL